MGLQFLSGMVIAFCGLFRFFGLSRQLWVLQLLFGELEPGESRAYLSICITSILGITMCKVMLTLLMKYAVYFKKA